MNKRNLIIASVTFILALGVGGFWYTNNSQKSKVESQKLGMNIDTEKQKDKTKLIQKFENFIKNHGKKIKLEKIDTTDWKTYTDKERGFSFKYPKDWYVVEIDQSKSVEDTKSPRMQKYYKKIHSDLIKSQVEQYEFLCITDKINYQKMINNKRCVPDKPGAFLDCYSDYCNFTFRESLPVLNSEKRTSGELWLESYKNNSRKKENGDWVHKYIQNRDLVVFSGNIDLRVFNFLSRQYNKLNISNYNGQTKGPTFTNIYQTLIQTIKRQ